MFAKQNDESKDNFVGLILVFCSLAFDGLT